MLACLLSFSASKVGARRPIIIDDPRPTPEIMRIKLGKLRPQMRKAQENGVSDFVKINANLDVNTLLDQIGKAVGFLLPRSTTSYAQVDGGVWVSGVGSDMVYSFYYHPTRTHRTSVKPGRNAKVFPSSPAWVPAGQWAHTFTKSSRLGGNKAYYDLK